MHKDCRPALFIGSSNEGVDIAVALKSLLDNVSESQVWKHGAFPPGEGALEGLERHAVASDFAVMVATRDDFVERRGKRAGRPIDNILIEIGLFIGTLGRQRTFIVTNQDPNLLPTNLLGITVCSFSDPTDGNLDNALAPVAAQIKRQVEKRRFRPENSGRLLKGWWNYSIKDAGGGHQWGGEGELLVDAENPTKVTMKGTRTWDKKGRAQKTVIACEWKTTLLVFGKKDGRLTLTFDHIIQLHTGPAQGTCELEIDEQFNSMKGYFYYHAPNANECGRVVFLRAPPPTRQSGAIAKPL